MTDVTDVDKRGWLASIFTVPNIITLGGLVVGGTMAYQAQVAKIDALTTYVQRNESRIERLEHRVDVQAATNEQIYQRRDVLFEQLRQIQEEQTRMREQLQALNRNLR